MRGREWGAGKFGLYWHKTSSTPPVLGPHAEGVSGDWWAWAGARGGEGKEGWCVLGCARPLANIEGRQLAGPGCCMGFFPSLFSYLFLFLFSFSPSLHLYKCIHYYGRSNRSTMHM